MRLTEQSLDRLESLAGDAFRRVGSLRLASTADEREALRREHDALREDGFARRVARRVDTAARRALRRRALASSRRRSPAGPLGAPPRRPGCRGRGRAPPGRAGRRSTASTRRRRRRHGRIHGRAAARARHGGRGDTRPGADHRAVHRAALPAPALRARRVRLLAPAPGRSAGDRRQPRRGDRRGANRRRSHDTDRSGADRGAGHPSDGRTAPSRSALGGDLGNDAGRVAARRPVPGRDGVWIAGGYSGHGNVLGLACGDLVARAILGERPPELELFDPSRLAPFA